MIALAFGCYFGYVVKAHEAPKPDQVKRALYIACARSRSFDPTETLAGSCNRLAIEKTLVAAYGGSAVIPPANAAQADRFESPLVELHQSLTQLTR
jgi:hypothetical protein